jgi:putative sigma-54 modulation protein
MNIDIRSIHFTADQKLLDFTEMKVGKLERFFDRIVSIEVTMRLDNMGQKVRDKLVELKIKVPGDLLVAEATSKTFEAAVENAVRTMKRRVVRYKEKLRR